jgi:hypothetical protein
MGRSSPAPPLRTPEGARFAVILRIGQGRLLDRMAARTRSRASRTAASGRPTIVKPGSPLETWTSTETGRPTAPLSVAEATAASTSGERSHPPAALARRLPGPGSGTPFPLLGTFYQAGNHYWELQWRESALLVGTGVILFGLTVWSVRRWRA